MAAYFCTNGSTPHFDRRAQRNDAANDRQEGEIFRITANRARSFCHHLPSFDVLFPFLSSTVACFVSMIESEFASGERDFRIRIPLVASDENDNSSFPSELPKVPESLIEAFRQDGFVVCPSVTSIEAIEALNDHLEDVLRGSYDRGNAPDKIPRLLKSEKPTNNMSNNSSKKKSSVGPIGFSGNYQNAKVLQIINMHKADSLFRKLGTDPRLGSLVATLAGWDQGARLAQDQVWAKPPGAPSLIFHRDSPYFMFEPDDVVTVWFALDDMDEELGPLEYVKGSHRWGDGRDGSSSQFYQHNPKSMLLSAAEREGIDPTTLEIVSMSGITKGSLSIHHGKTWHGSGKNKSKSKPRRGLGMHFVPANVRFTAEATHSKLWKSYIANADDPSAVELPTEDFPLPS
jgi:phytanoyl-CoA hydroxylase